MVSGLTFPRPVGGAELKRASQTRLCHSPELLRAAPRPGTQLLTLTPGRDAATSNLSRLPEPLQLRGRRPGGSQDGTCWGFACPGWEKNHHRRRCQAPGSRHGAPPVSLCTSRLPACRQSGACPHAQGQTARPQGGRRRKAGRPAGPGPRAPPGCRAPGSLLASPGNEPGKAGRGAQTRPAQNIHQEILPTAAPLPPRGRPWGSTLKIDRKSKNR